MKNILVAYATMSGTTAEVARKIGDEISKKGNTVSVLPVNEVNSLAGFDAVILGAPMIVGWHREARKFLKVHQAELAGKPLALFATAMNLTASGETSVDGVPVSVDEKLAQPLRTPGKTTFKENYSSITNYARAMIKAAGQNKPVSVALFGGRLDMYRLKWWAALLVLVIIQAKAGEKRNWNAIQTWAASLF